MAHRRSKRATSKRAEISLIVILLFGAMLPRLCAIDRTITPDELTWVYRSIHFREALIDGRWRDTLVAGHPGVTTSWLGALGISAQLVIRPADREIYGWLTKLAWMSPDLIPAFPRLATFLTAGRLAVALLCSLGVLGLYFLARPLFGQRGATLAAFMLAFDPFLSGLSGLLHVDGLAATFTILSLLVLMGRPKSWRSSAAAGLLSALAALTKSPTLLLVPFSALVLLIRSVRAPADGTGQGDRLQAFLRYGSIWLAAFLLTAILILPALWVAPADFIKTITSSVNRHATGALRPTFFMGQVAFEHGPHFYPVVLAFRLGPLVTIGLLLALWPVAEGRKLSRSNAVPILLLWVFLFVLLITPAAKKFDRYVLPAVPALILIAAAGWERLLSLRPRFSQFPIPHALVLLQALFLILVVPYPLLAYNPLLGGSAVASRVLSVGWGEGISAAARWLAEQPEAAETTATATNPLALASFFPGETLPFEPEFIPQAEVIILDANSRQLDPEDFERWTADASLIHTVELGGLEAAWVYKQATPQKSSFRIPDLETAYSFGNRVQLLGAAGKADAVKAELSVRWALVRPGGRYTVHLTLRDSWGHTWGKLESALLNEVNFHPEHWMTGETPVRSYEIKLPAGIPPADYQFELSLFDAEIGAQLPLLGEDGDFHGVTFAAGTVYIPAPGTPPSIAKLNIPVTTDAHWLNEALVLLGHSRTPETLLSGEGAHLDLFWRAQEALPADLTLQLNLGDGVQSRGPLSRSSTGQWQPGAVIHEQYTLPIPPELPGGRYPVSITPAAADGTHLDGPTVTLGTIEIKSPERVYELPAMISNPLDYRLGESIRLRGLHLTTERIAPGDQLPLTLYWQADAQPDKIYTAFVHLLGPDGAVVAQVDRWPGVLPTTIWAAGQVVPDELTLTIPESAPEGDYQIATGLYDAASGQHLTLIGPDGVELPGERLLLPVSVSVSESHD
jgi:hypothetical protein